MEHFPAFPPTTKLSCKVMVDCLREKPKFFQSKKNQTFCVVSIIGINPFGAFSSLSLLRRCLDFGLDFGHPLFVFLLPFPCGYVLFSLSINEASLSLSLFWVDHLHFCDTTKVLHKKFHSFCLSPTKNSFLRFRSNILGMNVRAGQQNINLFSCLKKIIIPLEIREFFFLLCLIQ